MALASPQFQSPTPRHLTVPTFADIFLEMLPAAAGVIVVTCCLTMAVTDWLLAGEEDGDHASSSGIAGLLTAVISQVVAWCFPAQGKRGARGSKADMRNSARPTKRVSFGIVRHCGLLSTESSLHSITLPSSWVAEFYTSLKMSRRWEGADPAQKRCELDFMYLPDRSKRTLIQRPSDPASMELYITDDRISLLKRRARRGFLRSRQMTGYQCRSSPSVLC